MEGSTVESEEARLLEQLELEIEEQTRIVSEMQHPATFLDAKILAKQQALLGSKVEERALILERRRVADVVQRFEEENPQETVDCPICLDPIPVHLASTDAAARFLCCGQVACSFCYELRALLKCPLCRAEFPSSDEEEWQMTLKLAERGCAWAQVDVSEHYEREAMNATSEDVRRMHEECALSWCQRAADQGDCVAQTLLGEMYLTGRSELVSQSFEEARRCFKAAAVHGHEHAQEMLGIICEARLDAPALVDSEQAIYWWTLSAANGGHIAQTALGSAFITGESFLDQCLYRAKFYLEKAAVAGNDAAMYHLASVLWDLGESVYGSNFIPGGSCVPRCLYWLRKALSETEDPHITRISLFEKIEGGAKSICANCGKTREACGGKLNCCARCKAVWYCGKDCQKHHWRGGHKIDCFSG